MKLSIDILWHFAKKSLDGTKRNDQMSFKKIKAKRISQLGPPHPDQSNGILDSPNNKATTYSWNPYPKTHKTTTSFAP